MTNPTGNEGPSSSNNPNPNRRRRTNRNPPTANNNDLYRPIGTRYRYILPRLPHMARPPTPTQMQPPPTGHNAGVGSSFSGVGGSGLGFEGAQHAIPVGDGVGEFRGVVGSAPPPPAPPKTPADPYGYGGGGAATTYFKCSVCGRPFMSQNAVNAHMKSHASLVWEGDLPPEKQIPATGGGSEPPEQVSVEEEEEDEGDYVIPDLNRMLSPGSE